MFCVAATSYWCHCCIFFDHVNVFSVLVASFPTRYHIHNYNNSIATFTRYIFSPHSLSLSLFLCLSPRTNLVPVVKRLPLYSSLSHTHSMRMPFCEPCLAIAARKGRYFKNQQRKPHCQTITNILPDIRPQAPTHTHTPLNYRHIEH